MPIAPANFEYIRGLARESAALVLEPGKEYLVETRLTPLAEQAGFTTLDAYINRLRGEKINGAHHRAVEALTINETFFFRDFHPFEALRQRILPQLIERRAGSRKINIWSAAAATGQEAYSIAMLLREHFPQLAGWNVSILATDLSAAVLEQAKVGAFSQLEVNRGLPALYLVKYFTKVADRWMIREDVRKLVEFRSLNLVKPWPVLPMFDIVFIRNVLIYFDVTTKKTILRGLRQCFHPEGYLFLGTAETAINLELDWKPVAFGKTTVFRL